MGLAVLVLGLVVFIGAHVLVSRREARARVIGRIGEGAYKGLFALASFVGIALIFYGYSVYRADRIIVWVPPHWTRHLTIALMLPAIVCAVAAYIPGHIKQTLKHPLLVGVKLWALAHLLTRGDLGSIVLFGSLLAWAVYDRISLKHRPDQGGPSISIGGWKNDVVALIVGILVYLAIAFTFHWLVIGVPVFGI